MKTEDLETYKKDGTKASKSQLKEFIKLYATIAKELKSENSIELNSVKTNIKETYSKEVYLTLIDEAKRFVKFNVSQGSKDLKVLKNMLSLYLQTLLNIAKANKKYQLYF